MSRCSCRCSLKDTVQQKTPRERAKKGRRDRRVGCTETVYSSSVVHVVAHVEKWVDLESLLFNAGTTANGVVHKALTHDDDNDLRFTRKKTHLTLPLWVKSV